MTLQFILVVSVLIIQFLSTLSARCGVAEEGSRHNISYQVTDGDFDSGQLYWFQRRNGFPATLALCTFNPNNTFTCVSNRPLDYQIQENNKNFTLTILNVTRVGQLPYIFSVVNGKELFSCNLTVYAKPEVPTCDPSSLIPNTTTLSVTCSTEKVFPEPKCVFIRKKFQGELSDVSYTNVSYTASNSLTYYRSTCTLTYTVNTPGIYTFEVDMFVDISGTHYGTQQAASDSINLTLPEGRLADSCFSGKSVIDGYIYIREETTATCRCDRVHDGLPEGQVQWYNTADQTVGTVDSGFATITVPTGDSVQNFTCKGKSDLGVQSSGKPFAMKFAHGPVRVNISPVNGTTIDLCSDMNPGVTIQCEVLRDDVSPHPSFTVFFNDTSIQGVNPGSDVYKYRVTNTPDTAGTLSVTCRAVNSVFSDLIMEDDIQISVRKPPSSSPQLIINNNEPVKENVTFPVSCHVDGGFPQVSGVSVTCKSDHVVTIVTSNTNVASKSVNVSRDMDGAQCECVAQHVTPCYSNNLARVNLTVTYQSTIQTFTANQNQTVIVDLHDHINLTCVADGNPTPTITIQNHRATDQKTDVGHRLTYPKDNVNCTDTAVYTCQANNFPSMDASSKAQVQVFVRCPQQPQIANGTSFSANVGNSATLDVKVLGYPAPRSYTLEQEGGEVTEVRATDGNGESGPYQFKYLSDDPPLGTVHLTIGNLSQGHFTNYLLTIDNGVGQKVEFSFVLEMATPDSDTDFVPIVAGVIGGVLFLVVIAAVIFLLKRQGVFDKTDRAHSSRLHDNEEEHVIPNDLYSGGANSGEVVIDNSDLYSGNLNRKSNEVVIDNSDLYSGFSKQGSNEVVVDNSALYGKSDDFKETREALYKNYTDVTPSMTSATAVPVNMKASNGAKQGGNSSYEDVEVGAKPPGPSVQPKPKVAVKPMTAAKPTPAPKPGGPPTSGPQGAFALQDDGGDQTYASVVKPVKPQAAKPQPASQRESDYFPDQSKKPEVPEKRYEQEETQTRQEGKKEQKKSSADKKNKNKKGDEIPMVSQSGAAASSSHDNPYVNGGYTEDDGNVYANAEGNKSRKD